VFPLASILLKKTAAVILTVLGINKGLLFITQKSTSLRNFASLSYRRTTWKSAKGPDEARVRNKGIGLNKKKTKKVIFHPFAHKTSVGGFAGLPNLIYRVPSVKCTKICGSQFRGFDSGEGQNLPFLTDLAYCRWYTVGATTQPVV